MSCPETAVRSADCFNLASMETEWVSGANREGKEGGQTTPAEGEIDVLGETEVDDAEETLVASGRELLLVKDLDGQDGGVRDGPIWISRQNK